MQNKYLMNSYSVRFKYVVEGYIEVPSTSKELAEKKVRDHLNARGITSSGCEIMNKDIIVEADVEDEDEYVQRLLSNYA